MKNRVKNRWTPIVQGVHAEKERPQRKPDVEMPRELLEVWAGAGCAGLDPITFDATRDEIPNDPAIPNAVRHRLYKESIEWRKYREAAAKRACGACDVLLQCSAWAMIHERETDEIWGGLTPREQATYRDHADTLKTILAGRS